MSVDPDMFITMLMDENDELKARVRELEDRLARMHEIRLSRVTTVNEMPIKGDIKIVAQGFEPQVYDFDGEGWIERA